MTSNPDNSREISIFALLRIALRNWYWYLLSLALCLGIAFYIYKSTQPVYERHALVLIKTRGTYSRLQDESAMFRDLNLPVDAGYLVDNELLMFKSRRLMKEVVRQLGLDVSYSVKGRLRYWDFYSSTPARLQFPDVSENDSFSCTLTPAESGGMLLHDFISAGKKLDTSVLVHVGDTVSTPLGRVVVNPNPYFGKSSQHDIDIKVRKSSLDNVASSFSARLQTSLASKTSTIINLSFSDTSSQLAEDVLNTLVQVYDQDAINDKNRVTVSTEEFLNWQLEVLEADLDDVDRALADYKSTNRLTDVASDAVAYRSTMNSVEQKLADLQNQKTVAEFILDYILSREQGEGRFDVIPNNTGINNIQVENLISEYNKQTLLREKLKFDAGENNPQIEDLSNSIDQMRSRILVSVRNLVQSLDIEIASVSKRAGASSGRLAAVPSQQKTVISVERQQKTKEQLYLYLLTKRQENALTRSMAQSSARILDPAMGSNSPVKPDKKILLIALLLGLAIPTLIFWLLVQNDTRVRSKKDLESLGDTPIVGEIPQLSGSKFIRKEALQNKTRNSTPLQMVFAAKSRDVVSESFRLLRTNINYLGSGGSERQVIMFTSLLPGAGKTFVSGNLALSLAIGGSKVLMLDLDIRRGSLSAGQNKGRKGVADYLCGAVSDVDSIIHHTDYDPKLDLIPVGSKAPNPAELLMLPSLDELVAELRKRYDYIIIDSVPANVVADAVISNRVADITLFVIRAGNLDIRMLPDVLRLRDEGKLRNMSVVLNGLADSHIYGSYYGYGYGYGYGHGYGYSSYYGSGDEK